MSEAEAKYRAWLARRRKIVEEHLPDVCTCYIGKPFAKAGASCKNCQVCAGCEQHIKNDCWDAHEAKCRALKDLRDDRRRQREAVQPSKQA